LRKRKNKKTFRIKHTLEQINNRDLPRNCRYRTLGSKNKLGGLLVGHYCKICGRTRANERFSGKGHKNNICKSCSGKSRKRGKNNISQEDDLFLDTKIISKEELIPLEDAYFNDIWFIEDDILVGTKERI